MRSRGFSVEEEGGGRTLAAGSEGGGRKLKGLSFPILKKRSK